VSEPGGRDLLRLLCRLIENPTSEQDALVALDSGTASALVSTARQHAVEAWLAEYAPQGEGAWAELAEQRARFVGHQMRSRAAIGQIDAVMAQLDIAWVVVKGPVLAEELYPRPRLRFGVDIDVLIPPARFGDAIDALSECGWHLIDRNWPLFVRTCPGELRMLAPNGALLDLHWHLLTGTDHRQAFALPTVELLERRRRLPSGLPALDPADQVVHLGLHAALGGATRLSWLLDLALAASAIPDFSTVISRSRPARASRPLFLGLGRARRWLPKTTPPARELAVGASWPVLCSLVDRMSPLGPDPDEPSLARSFARSARESVPQSLSELTRHGAGWIRGGAPRHRAESPILDQTDPRSPMFAVDDADVRAEFLELVARVAG
jgi:hypothetical protein